MGHGFTHSCSRLVVLSFVPLLHGCVKSLTVTQTAGEPSGLAGPAVGIGDVAGDASPDFVVADALHSKVYVLPGGGNSTSYSVDQAIQVLKPPVVPWIDKNGNPDYEFSLAAVPDVNGDHTREMLVGSRFGRCAGDGSTADTPRGEVWLYLSTGDPSQPYPAAASATWCGHTLGSEETALGSSVAAFSANPGSGAEVYLALGASQYGKHGAVLVFNAASGDVSPSGIVARVDTINPDDSTISFKYPNTDAVNGYLNFGARRFGRTLLTIPSYAPGTDGLLICDPEASVTNYPGSDDERDGACFLFKGSALLSAQNGQSYPRDADVAFFQADYSNGVGAPAFGTSATWGQINGDGRPDLVIGGPAAFIGPLTSSHRSDGAVWVFVTDALGTFASGKLLLTKEIAGSRPLTVAHFEAPTQDGENAGASIATLPLPLECTGSTIMVGSPGSTKNEHRGVVHTIQNTDVIAALGKIAPTPIPTTYDLTAGGASGNAPESRQGTCVVNVGPVLDDGADLLVCSPGGPQGCGGSSDPCTATGHVDVYTRKSVQ